MKKRLVSAVLLLAMIFTLSACEYVNLLNSSKGLTKNGYLEGVTALDYVKLPDYHGREVSEKYIDALIASHLGSIAGYSESKTGSVENYDIVSISYVGTIDGVAFQGGTASDQEVIIGVTSYIDGFLDQIIGHQPGDQFDIVCTFPENYDKADLQGKEAVFATTLECIKHVSGEYTDEMVVENLYNRYGWNNLQEVRSYYITQTVFDQLLAETEFTDIPNQAISYQKGEYDRYYRSVAAQLGVEFDNFLTEFGYENEDQMMDDLHEAAKEDCKKILLFQAIAETEGFEPVNKDAKMFINEKYKNSYNNFKRQYGEQYLVYLTMHNMVEKVLEENVALI